MNTTGRYTPTGPYCAATTTWSPTRFLRYQKTHRGLSMTKPSVEIIIVKYNQPAFEAGTIEHIVKNTHYPEYSLRAYQNPRGIGLAKCWNDLIEQSNAEYICLLNSDTVVPTMWLTDLMSIFDNFEGVGCVVPSSNQAYLSEIEVPFAHTTTDYKIIQNFATLQRTNIGTCVSMPTASAMCVVFSKAMWEEIGGFDEEYFLYGEDTEFFYRMIEKAGLQAIWYQAVYVHHYKAQSVAKAVEDGEIDIAEIRARATALCQAKMPGMDVRHGYKEADGSVTISDGQGASE